MKTVFVMSVVLLTAFMIAASYGHNIEPKEGRAILQPGHRGSEWSAYDHRSNEHSMASNQSASVVQLFVPGRWVNGKWVQAHTVRVPANPHSLLCRWGSKSDHFAKKILALELKTMKMVENEIGAIHRDLRAVES